MGLSWWVWVVAVVVLVLGVVLGVVAVMLSERSHRVPAMAFAMAVAIAVLTTQFAIDERPWDLFGGALLVGYTAGWAPLQIRYLIRREERASGQHHGDRARV